MHVGETAREERRGQFDDMMFRFEPGDEVRFMLAADFAEADKGVHLVLVAAYCLRHRGDLGHIRVGRDIKQIVILPQPSQQAIEQGEPRHAAMQDRNLRQFDGIPADTLKVPSGGSSGGAVGSNSSGASSATFQVTSDGFTSFSASARAALRQPSKSVSLSRLMMCISLLPSLRAKRSNPCLNKRRNGLLRGSRHRAGIRPTRWLAMTLVLKTQIPIALPSA